MVGVTLDLLGVLLIGVFAWVVYPPAILLVAGLALLAVSFARSTKR